MTVVSLLRALSILALITLSANMAIGQPALDTFRPNEASPLEADRTDLGALLRLLENPQTLEALRRALEEEGAITEKSSLRAEISAAAKRIELRIAAVLRSFGAAASIPDSVGRAWASGLEPGDTLRTLTYVLIFLFIGGGLEWLFRQYSRPLQLRLAYGPSGSIAHRLTKAAGGAALHFSGLLIFAAGSIGTFAMFYWPPLIRELVIDLLIAVLSFRLAGVLVLLILAPGMPELRLVPFGNRRARLVSNYLLASAFVAMSGFVAADGILRLAEATGFYEELASAIIVFPVIAATILAGILIALIWRQRKHFSDDPDQIIKGSRPIYLPVVNTALVTVILLLWLIGATDLMWTAIVLGLLFPAIRIARAVIDNFYDQAEEAAALKAKASDREPQSQGPTVSVAEDLPPPTDSTETDETDFQSYATQRLVVRRFVRIMLILAAFAGIGWAWGFGILSLSDSPTITGRIFRVIVNVVVTLLLADLIWTWARVAIDRKLAAFGPVADGLSPGPEARMATLLPILRMFLMITVLVIVILTVLSSIGINIGPLLAGAGVAGIAIGFGAQALVRDVVSGIFYLLDDAFRVGEYIEMGDLRGTVESMSIRSLRVRHHLGAVHTIPFGELKSLTNYSRDWVIMKLEFRVPFETDLKLVKKIVKQVGAELQAHEGYGQHLIQPLKSQGVRRMEEFNMVIGVKFMARPGAQWLIRRDAYQKLRDAFEKNGIHFATRNVRVEVSSETPLPDDVRKAVAGAAQEAVEKRPGVKEPVPDEP